MADRQPGRLYEKFLFSFFLAAGLCSAADVRFTWLLTSNTVPGLPAPDSPQYGAEVFMDSDNPSVTEFQIVVVAQLASGDIVTQTGTGARTARASNAAYSTSFAAWFGATPDFQILSIQVKAVVGKNAPKAFPGPDYSIGGTS